MGQICCFQCPSAAIGWHTLGEEEGAEQQKSIPAGASMEGVPQGEATMTLPLLRSSTFACIATSRLGWIAKYEFFEDITCGLPGCFNTPSAPIKRV